MSEWGINDEGVTTPSYSEILDYFAKRWEDEFGTQADMSSRSPEGQFLRVIAESLSNKGLPWSDITSIWDTIEDVYNAGFIETASGTSLDHLIALRGLNRNKAQPAEGNLVFQASEGTEIPRGTVVESSSGMAYETIRPAEANKYGVAPVTAQATDSGPDGNIVANSKLESDVGEVENPVDTHKFHIGSVVNDWTTITNDESFEKYQKVAVGNLKYATNVDEITFRVRATETGTYGLYFLVLGYETGKEFYRTETTDTQLTEGVEQDITFRGEGFDLLKESVEESVRLVPMNADYSASDIEIALQDAPNNGGWYIGNTEQPYALHSSITTTVNGNFTGGRDRENDVELKNRFLNSLSRGGSTRPSALEAEFYKVDSIRFVEIRENTKSIDLRPEGLPPNSIEAIVWGGRNEEILQALLNAKPVGVNTYGNKIGVVEDEFGQVHNLNYSRADEIDIHIEINAVTATTFPSTGGEQVKNICAEVIGGQDLNGIFHPGRVGVGDTLYQSELESELHDRISGLRSVRTSFGTNEDNIEDSDLDLDTYETSVTEPENIYINRGK